MPPPWYSVWIGWDMREAPAFFVTYKSLRAQLSTTMGVHGIMLDKVREEGLYWRPTEFRDGRLFDVISDHPMSTEFAISRFLTPLLHKNIYQTGWTLFMDCDMLVRSDILELFSMADPRYAVMCVKHNHAPANTVKMDNQVQSNYHRKNWSSVMLFNTDHPSNSRLTLDMINTLPGRDLHRFCWLEDHEIGELDIRWNWLVGSSPKDVDPKIVHFTEGWPGCPGYENVPYADEWRKMLHKHVVGVF